MEDLNKMPEFLGDNPVVYEAGLATNPISRESFELTSVEMTVYRAVIQAEKTASQIDSKYMKTLDPDDANEKAVPFWELIRSGGNWFKENNAEAYMKLLD